MVNSVRRLFFNSKREVNDMDDDQIVLWGCLVTVVVLALGVALGGIVL